MRWGWEVEKVGMCEVAACMCCPFCPCSFLFPCSCPFPWPCSCPCLFPYPSISSLPFLCLSFRSLAWTCFRVSMVDYGLPPCTPLHKTPCLFHDRSLSLQPRYLIRRMCGGLNGLRRKSLQVFAILMSHLTDRTGWLVTNPSRIT